MLIGYARVSKADGSHSLDPPRDALQAAGIDAGNVYHDFASGVPGDRPGLEDPFRYCGIQPSFALLEEPETDGVVERWNRTLKEQAVYGRVLRNVVEVRAAVAVFAERYNQCWPSRSWRIARRSKGASNTSYAEPSSTTVSPRKRVRYR